MQKSLMAMMFLIFLGATGCANIKVSDPVPVEYTKAQSYIVDYGVVWSATVDWFANNNIMIDKIEKTSGLLTARYTL